MVEGIQMFEKIQVLKQNPRYAKSIEKLLKPFAYKKINAATLGEDIKRLNAFL